MKTAVPRDRIRLPLLAIVAAAIALIAARMVWPKLLFDTTSLILFGIAALAWALAYVPVTKLKWGDFEAELEPLVAALGQKVIAAEAAPSGGRTKSGPDVVYRGGAGPAEGEHPRANAVLREFQDIVGSADSDRDKVLRVTDLVERLAGEGGLDFASQAAVDNLQRVRNAILHGTRLNPDDTLSTLDYAGRLLRKITG